MAQYHWDPFELLMHPQGRCYAVMKLNSRFQNDQDLQLFVNAWKNASIRCAADGGSNVLHRDVSCTHQAPTLPHFISGDFDSATPEVLHFYKSKGVEIIDTPDQNETDFTKCLRIVLEKAQKEGMKLQFVVAHVGTSSRRLDHTFSNINTLINHAFFHQAPPLPKKATPHQNSTTPSSPTPSSPTPSSPTPSTHHPSFNSAFVPDRHPFLFLVIGDSVNFILPPGTHSIATTSALRGKWCSLVPVVAPTTTTTRGLAYNLEDQVMAFGGLISTSNAFLPSSDHVFVQNDQPLLWSMAIKF